MLLRKIIDVDTMFIEECVSGVCIASHLFTR